MVAAAGDGESVWLVADHNLSSLLSSRAHPFRRATDGTPAAARVATDGGVGHRSVADEHRALGVGGHVVLVGDQHDRPAGPVEVVEQGEHLRGRRRVEVLFLSQRTG